MTVVLTTKEGLLFLAIGNAVGALLSLILFSLTGGLVPTFARARGRFRHGHGDQCASGGDEPVADDRLGRAHCDAADCLGAAVLSGPRGDTARASRSCDLAFVQADLGAIADLAHGHSGAPAPRPLSIVGVAERCTRLLLFGSGQHHRAASALVSFRMRHRSRAATNSYRLIIPTT